MRRRPGPSPLPLLLPLHGALACLGGAARAVLSSLRGRGEPAPASYRQRLENRLNTQYHGEVEVGGQRVAAILDTGSFDLLVLSAGCAECPDPPYDPSASSTFRAAPNASTPVVHSFGSGPTRSLRGYERVRLGPYVVQNQTFFQVVSHNISALNESGAFNAIVGIGPQDGSGSSAPSLLTNLGVAEFSVCLERAPLAPGWLTWGGPGPAARRHSVELRVIGRRHWAVQMQRFLPDVELSEEQHAAAGMLLCARGCAAVLDSGTSLISAPSHALRGLELLLPTLHENCSNFGELPDLELELDGNTVRLPPAAYVMRLGGRFLDALSVWERLHIRPNLTLPDQCFYGFLRLNAHTDFGPLWVLGMPFFRIFHVTFGLAPEAADRRIWLAGAADDCEPLPLELNASAAPRESPRYRGVGVHPKVVVAQERRAARRATAARRPLTVDAPSLRMPGTAVGAL